EAELHQSRSKVSEVEEEKEKLNSKLKESNSKLEQAQQELEKTKGAEKNVRSQLAGAQGSLKKIQETGNGDAKAQEALKGEIAQLQKALTVAEQGRATAEKERDSQNAKLADANSQIAKISKERDDAMGQLVGLKDSEHRVAVLLAENTELKEKLETAKLTRENQILRNIVVRERQEEARREQAKKLMLAEFDKLKIKSDTLNEQVALLAQPVTKLTDEELALLRQPVISISDESPNTVKASFTYAKPSTGNQPGEPIVETTDSPAPPEANLQNGFKPDVPTDLID